MKKNLLLIIWLIGLQTGKTFAQWYPDIRMPLSNFPKTQTQTNNRHLLAASGNSLHVIWVDGRNSSEGINNSNSEIYYSHSDDGGTTWFADNRISNNPGYSGDPCLAVSGSEVHVVWANRIESQDGYEIMYKRSGDGGLTWGAETRLTNDPFDSEYPVVAASGQNVYVVWKENRDAWVPALYYKCSTDGGLTWTADTRLTYETSGKQFPAVAAAGQYVYVAWTDFRDGIFTQVYFKRSADGGITWDADTRLSNNLRDQRYPTLAAEGSSVHIAWEKNVSGYGEDIMYRRSLDGGITWNAEMDLTNSTSGEMKPNIAVSGQQVHVAWNDNRNSTEDIFATSSGDGGTTWGMSYLLTHKPFNWMYSRYPSVAASGANAWVVWEDSRTGNGDLFYTHNGAPACNMSAAAGSDEHLYFGYAPGQCITKNVTVTNGTAPLSYSWTLNRPLLSGESMTGTNTAAVTVCLMDTAELCVTVTDANDCHASDCAMIFAEDVRCGTGNNQKISICHNGNQICVDGSAVPGHLAHGDYVGTCATSNIPGGDRAENSLVGFEVFPNPSNGTVNINLPAGNGQTGIIRIFNEQGKLVRQLNSGGLTKLSLRLETSGIYLVQWMTVKEILTKRLLILK